MNFGRSVSNLTSKFGLTLRISTPIYGKNAIDVKKIPTTAFTDIGINQYKNPKSLLIQHELGLTSFYCKGEVNFTNIPKADVPVMKKIIEPEKFIKQEIPLRNTFQKELNLPCIVKKDMIEPTEHVISKKAANMINIRKRKMRIHQRKRHAVKYKAKIQKQKLLKAQKKEQKLKSELQNIIAEAKDFDAEEQVKEKLELLKWKPPIRRIRGFLAPEWVIKETLQIEKENEIFKQRIKECSERLKY